MRKTLGWICVAASLSYAAACGSVAPAADAGPNDSDAAPTIDAGMPADASMNPDAMPPVTSAPPATDLTSGGGKLSGTTYSMDVQLGHPFMQGKVTGGGKTVEGGAAIKP
jgi:hypothetical protein